MNGARKRLHCLLRENFFVWTVRVVSLMEWKGGGGGGGGGRRRETRKQGRRDEDETVPTQIQ
jgi:hypothetical protein